MSLANRVTLPLALFSLVLLAACGTNNNVSTNNNGYTNTDFSGTYVFSFFGTDANGETESFFAIAGTVTADGNGNITGGTVDINDANLGAPGVFTAQALSASTYSVGSDGRGSGSLITPQGTFGIDFVLTSDTHGLISRFDTTGSGSGTLDIQGSATQGSLTSLAFSLFGSDANFNNLGTVGAFTLNGSGTISPAGLEDFNDNGSSGGFTSLALNGSLVLSSATNGTAVFNTAFAGLTFDVWVVDSSHLKLIETDTTSGYALAGDAFPQQSTFTGGQLVFTFAGADVGEDPLVAGGFVTTDTNGTLTNGIEDYDDAGNLANAIPFTGTCNATAPFAGDRCELALTGFGTGTSSNLSFAAYPTTSGVLLLEDDSAGFLQGAAFAQTATAFGSPEGYGLNLSGFNLAGGGNGEVDDIAEFNTTTSPSNNMSGVLDENDINSALITSGLSGTYTPDSPATGRGSMSISTPATFLTGLTLEYYVLGSSSTLFIEQDDQQLSMGVFELQSSPGSSVKKAGGNASAVQSIVSLVHPFRKSKMAAKHRAQK
jgi:hypothetical protein